MKEASGIKVGAPSILRTAASSSRKEPSGLQASQDADGQSVISRVAFTSLARHISDDGTFVEVAHRDVTLQQDEARELSGGSTLSQTGLDATLPMAFDNERFFDSEEGYQDLLQEAVDKTEHQSRLFDSWAEANSEVGFFGWLWRFFLRLFLQWTADGVNRLRYTRGLQIFLPFQTGYESLALGGVVRSFDLDERGHDGFQLQLAFKNRNASRILAQNMTRWDRVWHLGTAVRWSRLFDMLGQFPIIGVTAFPATENFPSTKNHAIRATLRRILEGTWLTRSLTRQQEGLVTLDRNTPAQNLAAESNGFEEANRNQYGTLFGREKTNEFRFEHRLPTDESIVRTFMASPASTMINNGVEHVLRCLAKHWKNMLYQENGNFAHQRQEQLAPFEVLRFHMPEVLSVLANLRGRNVWDQEVLGPFIKRLQSLNPGKVQKHARGDPESADLDDNDYEIYGPCRAGQKLVADLKEIIVRNVCAGIASRVEPFHQWLDAISDAFIELSREAEAVKSFVDSVNVGIRLGYQLLKLVHWRVPSDAVMKRSVMEHCLGKYHSTEDLPRSALNAALHKLAPKDERTLRELLTQNLQHLEAAQMLVERTVTLLERELRRKALDDKIQELSKGSEVQLEQLDRNKWYWAKVGQEWRVYTFVRHTRDGKRLKFKDVQTNLESLHEATRIKILKYIPVAEAISRAQKAFMTIELDHGKRFSYDTFMEFGSAASDSSLRTRLRRLVILSQVHCPALDQARLNVLTEVKNSMENLKNSRLLEQSRLVPGCRPQNVMVLGGGPTGLLASIHCTQNVLLTGGTVKLYEGRDAFDQEAASFERAQIVRLDARQIAMLRYHLGSSFEDVYIPVRGETDSHVGNTLPSQRFVEVTIKRLESMLLDEVINLRSKELLDVYADSKIHYDANRGTLEKNGRSLKVGDCVLDAERKTLCVKGFVYESSLQADELLEGIDYDVVHPREKKVRSYRLVQRDHSYDFYQLTPHEAGVPEISGSFNELPPIYVSGQGRIEPTGIRVQQENSTEEVLSFDEVANKTFQLDVSASHVILAIGKQPSKFPTHLRVTTEEPYAVCCIEGIKVTMGMHNFGRTRWGSGLVDDVRSLSDQNTRVVGDFTKSVNLMAIVKKMQEKLSRDPVWKSHVENLASSLNDRIPSLYTKLVDEVEKLSDLSFRRERLQTRFFELGNNYYLGMELPREYDAWKENTVSKIAPNRPSTAPDSAKGARMKLKKTLNNHIDRLWYECTLEVIAAGDVYNPGGRSQIPQLYTIDSPFEQKLGELQHMEAFRLFEQKYRVQAHDGDGLTQIRSEREKNSFPVPCQTFVVQLATGAKMTVGELTAGDLFQPVDTFEIVAKHRGSSVVRTSGGYVVILPNKTRVGRVGDLSRGPDGYSESKVALSSFPVAHIVSHRTLHVNRTQGKGGEDGYLTAYVGDAQASPHFMRYSGLTGACINCMSFNNLVGQALRGVSFQKRIQRYAFETNWSNGEVVQRGTGANYGEDGFLRPGFTYGRLLDYLFDRGREHVEIGAQNISLLTRDWKVKIAAAVVPRGLETNGLFIQALLRNLEMALHQKYEQEVMKSLGLSESPPTVKNAVLAEMKAIVARGRPSSELGSSSEEYSQISDEQSRVVKETGVVVSLVVTALTQTIDHAVKLRLHDERVSSELFHQPKPVDSLVDDFAVEAQNFANSLTQSSAFAAATIALRLSGERGASIASAVLGVWNIGVSFGTMTNASRYRNRNEEMRTAFAVSKMKGVMKAVFSLMTKDQQDKFLPEENPFLSELDQSILVFLAHARYYNVEESKILQFEAAYSEFLRLGKDRACTIRFARELVQEFIPDIFHENSYLQEDLVRIYKELYEMLDLSRQNHGQGMSGAEGLYRMLLDFQPKLEASLERGDIKHGFIRERSWHQTEVPVTLRYLLSPILGRTTVAGKILSILKKAEAMQSSASNDVLKRPIRDLRELYHATKESEVGSMIVLTGFVVFCFSIFFSVFRLVEWVGGERDWVRIVLDASAWAALGSMLGASLAAFHFVRKLKHLFNLHAALRRMRTDPQIHHVIKVTRTQEWLTVVRLATVVAAAVALPWSIALSTWGSKISSSEDIPVYIASAAVVAAVGATIFFLFVEFFVRYNLDPCLGPAVCEPLRGTIEDIKQSCSAASPGTDVETDRVKERKTWEYTTRDFLHEYRFDTVFAADRFGSIVQFLQSKCLPAQN